VREAVEIRDSMGVDTLILGNGDVKDIADAKKKIAETGCDGVMLGRAIFGNPWLFDQKKGEVSIEEKLAVCIEHTKLFEELLGEIKSFAIMKKHYKAYVNGFPGATELRERLMSEAQNAGDVERIIAEFLNRNL
jgi:tRNA-dihydrouridine synthase